MKKIKHLVIDEFGNLQQRAEMALCWSFIALAAGTFADCAARGMDSFFGRFFVWWVTVVAG